MTEDSAQSQGGIERLASPDIYTLELPADRYEDITQWESGKLSIEQTPEQREAFLDWMAEVLADEGRSVRPATDRSAGGAGDAE